MQRTIFFDARYLSRGIECLLALTRIRERLTWSASRSKTVTFMSRSISGSSAALLSLHTFAWDEFKALQVVQ